MSYDEDFEEYQYVPDNYEDYEDYEDGYQYSEKEDDEDQGEGDVNQGEGAYSSEEDEEDEYGVSPPGDEDQYYDDEYDTNTGFQGEFYMESGFRFRSVRDVILARMHGIMGNAEYSDFSNEVKNKSIILIERIPEKKIILYSIDVLVPVALFMSQYKKQVSKNNVIDFFKKTSDLKNVNHLDFIRYIRIVNNLENDGLLIY